MTGSPTAMQRRVLRAVVNGHDSIPAVAKSLKCGESAANHALLYLESLRLVKRAGKIGQWSRIWLPTHLGTLCNGKASQITKPARVLVSRRS